MDEVIRILIVDDHAVVREGQRALIETEEGMVLIGECADGAEAIQLSNSLQPDLILMDLKMPKMGGIEAIEKIKNENPHIRILVLTSFSEDENVFLAIKSGASGYLLKDATPDELITAIRTIHRGDSHMDKNIAQKLMRELQRTSDLPQSEEPLTVRELDVLRLVARGLTNLEISNQLYISERTVRTHVSHILDKLHLINRTQATLYALREGLADLNS